MPSRTPRLTERMAQRQREERERQLHRERMRRYRARQRLHAALFAKEYPWNRILDVRLRRNKFEFHVEWEPESARAPYTYTWEPALNVKGAIEWIHEHHPSLWQKLLDLKTIQQVQ
jgi:hypothetical protein